MAEMAAALYEQLRASATDTKAETRRRFAEGEPIPEGQRDVAIFWLAVELLRDGLEPAVVLERVLEAGLTQCVPPLDDKLIRKQYRGAAKWVATHPTEQERLHREARRVLDERRAGHDRASRRIGQGRGGGRGCSCPSPTCT